MHHVPAGAVAGFEGGGLVPTYRVFWMLDARQIMGPPTDMECASDDDAISRARQLLDGHDLEIWQRERFIIRLVRKD
jgi:hypothetical protein